MLPTGRLGTSHMLTQITCHILPGPSEGRASVVPILQNRKLSHSRCIAGKWLSWDLKLGAGPCPYLPLVTGAKIVAASCSTGYENPDPRETSFTPLVSSPELLLETGGTRRNIGTTGVMKTGSAVPKSRGGRSPVWARGCRSAPTQG